MDPRLKLWGTILPQPRCRACNIVVGVPGKLCDDCIDYRDDVLERVRAAIVPSISVMSLVHNYAESPWLLEVVEYHRGMGQTTQAAAKEILNTLSETK